VDLLRYIRVRGWFVENGFFGTLNGNSLTYSKMGRSVGLTMLVLKIVTLWLSFDIILLATGWYLATTVRPLCPDWWRKVVVDEVSPIANR